MAQKVHYSESGFEDGTKYKEGPFVYCDGNGFRIEVQLVGHKYPSLPDASIIELLEVEELNFGKTHDESKIIKAVDFLNQKVKDGKIICKDNKWIVE